MVEVAGLIHRTSLIAGTVGAVLSPIPLLDELVFVPLYSVLAIRIAGRHALPILRMPWKPIVKTTLGGLVARGIVNLGVALIPGVSAVANAATAVALTEVLGRYLDHTCAAPAAARSLGVTEMVGLLRKRQPAPDPAVVG